MKPAKTPLVRPQHRNSKLYYFPWAGALFWALFSAVKMFFEGVPIYAPYFLGVVAGKAFAGFIICGVAAMIIVGTMFILRAVRKSRS